MLLAGVSPTAAKRKMLEILSKTGGKIDYVSICDRFTLDEIKKFEGDCLIALAVKIGKARLIDNIEVIKKGIEERSPTSVQVGDRG